MDDPALLSFGLWIKRRRKALDLTQDALAALVGCSKDLIVKIEGDARRPRVRSRPYWRPSSSLRRRSARISSAARAPSSPPTDCHRRPAAFCTPRSYLLRSIPHRCRPNHRV